MKLFNKYETVGIFLSIALMALVLVGIRFKDSFSSVVAVIDSEKQGAVVAVSQEKDGASANLEKALYDSFSAGGELVELVVDDVRIGSGEKIVTDGDKITVHYEGTLQNGTKFDSSYDRGEPFTFTIGEGAVIQGWEKGLIGMKVGGERVLVIPSDMAYGNRQVGPIPPNSVLVFKVSLLKIE